MLKNLLPSIIFINKRGHLRSRCRVAVYWQMLQKKGAECSLATLKKIAKQATGSNVENDGDTTSMFHSIIDDRIDDEMGIRAEK